MKCRWAYLVFLLLFGTQLELHAEGSAAGRDFTASLEILVDGKLSGSGWIATPDGLALTAAHVVKGARSLEVLTADGQRQTARLLAMDMGHDLALLKLEHRHGFLPSIPLAAGPLLPLDRLHLVGSPLFRHRLTLPGQLASNRLQFEWNERNQCYTEIRPVAAMTPDGVSGAAWCNPGGQVVGMQSGMMLHQGSLQGIAFMAPGEAIAELLAKRRNASSNWLGANIAEGWEVSGEISGLLVTRVLAGGPAERAGLKRGDRILALGNHPLTYRDDLLKKLRELPTGGEAMLDVSRQKDQLQIKLPLWAREQN